MKKTLRKVLDELQKDEPNLSYIRGMLEVLIDEPEERPIYRNTEKDEAKIGRKGVSSDEEANMLEMKAKAGLGRVDLTAIQTEN